MNAPKDTKIIWWLIAIIKVVEKFMYGSTNIIIKIKWNKHPPIAWYILLTDNGKLLLNFFCQRVEAVIATSATIDAKIPIIGNVLPTSYPKTKHAPKNPKITPIHCFHVTFSLSIGPASAFVNIGWSVTIKAAMPVGKPFETEKKKKFGGKRPGLSDTVQNQFGKRNPCNSTPFYKEIMLRT